MKAFYFIDKPIWITSFDVVRQLKKKLKIKKIGHTGTLDPLATWWLILAVWEYTKLIPYLEKDTKEYIFEMMLDWTTASYDLAEEIKFLSKEKQDFFKQNLKKEKIEEILKINFSWTISQLPPKYSALKINWKRACDLLREGKDVELKARNITIFKIEILKYEYPKLELKALVSAGTYVRSITSDLWDLLWTWAYVINLRRTKIWWLDIKYSQKLDDFDSENKLDIKTLFKDKNFIQLDLNTIRRLNDGLQTAIKLDISDSEDLFVFDEKNITNVVAYKKNLLIPKRRI